MIDRRYANTPHGQVHYRITGDGDALVLLGPAGRSAAKVRAFWSWSGMRGSPSSKSATAVLQRWRTEPMNSPTS